MKNLLFSLFGACTIVFFCSVAWAQQTNISSASGIFHAVARDGADNMVAAGYIENAGTSSDFTVVKLDGASGAELWRQVINGSANDWDEARAVAVDGAGNVIAAGRTQNIDTGSSDFTVVKFDGASGAELWRQVINGSASWYDVARAVAVDGAGDVVAVGDTYNSGTNRDFTVIKFDGASGAELWRQVIDGGDNRIEYYRYGDEARAVAVDGTGNIVAAGTIENVDTYNDFTVVKFDGVSGVELWRQVIDGGGDDVANAVSMDGAGNVIAAGVTTHPPFPYSLTGSDFTVAKFEGASGVELWRQVINGRAYGNDVANAVAVDGAGNVVAAGFGQNPNGACGGFTGQDFTVVKLDGASGVELWRQVSRGSAAGLCQSNEALAVTLDGGGDVIAAGITRAQSWQSQPDFTVVKFQGTIGLELWRQVISWGMAEVVTVNGAGKVIAAGSISGLATVIEFDGNNGEELWRQTSSGF